MGGIWTRQEWSNLEEATRRAVAAAPSETDAWRIVTKSARSILRNYSTSFFLVTRFLPTPKRTQVDVIYAAVRYPDEVVDTFPITPAAGLAELETYRAAYREALLQASLPDPSWRRAVADGLPVWAAAFAEVVRRNKIPHEYYEAFLDAMAADASPHPYRDLNHLIDGYIYGSAIVVGYFLAYVYGATKPSEFPRVLESSRNLGIALQLTNFLRDVAEDQRRGRVYLPQDMLAQEGLDRVDTDDPAQLDRLNRVLQRLSSVAEDHYAASEQGLDAFSPDCRIAIKACIDVYRRLNLRIGRSPEGIRHRESVPTIEKFNALPPSKFWRVPLAYLGGL